MYLSVFDLKGSLPQNFEVDFLPGNVAYAEKAPDSVFNIVLIYLWLPHGSSLTFIKMK